MNLTMSYCLYNKQLFLLYVMIENVNSDDFRTDALVLNIARTDVN